MKKATENIFTNVKKQFRYLCTGVVVLAASQIAAQPLAFPSAEGFGRFALGGRGGTVYKVTNLNDAGPGSFRDAVSQPDRTVVFTVGGIISITSRVIVKNNITIAGQTAPGGGICIYGDGLSFSGANNSIVRYIRIRMGINGSTGKDAVAIANGSNIIFDHVSVSWGRDGTVDVNPDSGAEIYNLTFQNCIIGQGLQTHSTGGLMQSTGGVSILRCLYIDNNSRNPKVKGQNQFVNNVIYNWVVSAYIQGGDSEGLSEANVTNNYFINGPNSTAAAFTGGNANFSIYASNNFQDANKDGTLNGTLIPQASYGPVTWKTTPYPYPTVTQLTPQAAYNYVITNAGYNTTRDKTDARLLTELQSVGTIGETISNENSAPMNGVGTISGGTAPADADNDGMANSWESANGTNPNVADNNGNIDGDSYTNLEEYLNFLTGENSGASTTSITIQENTTGFCNVEGTIDNNNTGFTGTGFANVDNAANAGVTWRINAPAAGTYTLAWRYANGGTTNRPSRLLVNGTQVIANIDFPVTTNWTTWTEVSVSRALSAGVNTIRLEGITANGPANIDYLKVTGNNPAVLSCAGVAMRTSETNSSRSTVAVKGGISEAVINSTSVYPNPSPGAFTIRSKGKFSYAIFNASGKELEVGKASEMIRAGASYPSGTYFIRIIKDGSLETVKVTRQ